jgi:tRNA wybutosine-synthesizing protein 2
MRIRKIPADMLRSLRDAPWVDLTKKPYREKDTVFVPVREGYSSDEILPPRHPYRGRRFTMIGSIAVLQGKEPTDEEISELEEWKKPTAILWIRSCQGRERIPDVRVLSGESSDVCHREMGMVFWLDPARVMFSKGNRGEKVRMMGLIRKEERVADMFAGIGYFTIPAARSGARVHAMEINPVAFRYLCRNIRENRVDSLVTAGCGDCRDLLSGYYNRVIMGHFESPALLGSALSHTLPGGIIHLHLTASGHPEIPGTYRRQLELAGCRRIKKVAPHTWHYVLDLKVAG